MNELAASANNTIINVTNLGVNMTNERLRRMFEKYGTITSYGILNDAEPWHRFAFVAFDDSDAADEAVIEMNGQSIDDNRRIRVRRTTKKERNNNANKKSAKKQLERPKTANDELIEGVARDLDVAMPAIVNHQNSNIGFCIYVRNLDKNVDRLQLRDAFQSYGPIIEAKVIFENTGFHTRQSRGYGFVTFAREESAQRAIREKSGRLIGTQIVHVEMSLGPRWLRDTCPSRGAFDLNQRHPLGQRQNYTWGQLGKIQR